MTCQWPPGCGDSATHTLTIKFPDDPEEVWGVCREHDRQLKNLAVASRPQAVPPPPTPTTIEVFCGACGVAVAERSDLPADQRQPCPACGSLERSIHVGINETLSLHESVRVTSRRPGRAGWLVDYRTGDDYTRLLEGWGRRDLRIDRDNDQYRERIELHDGTTIESTAHLRDHQ